MLYFQGFSFTPLYAACLAASLGVVQALLSAPNIDPNLCASVDYSPCLPLMLAMEPHVPTSILTALLAHPRVDVNARDPSRSWSAIHFLACRDHDTRHLEILLTHPWIQINCLTAFGSSALHLAARSGAVSTLRLLLRPHLGADVNLLDAGGETSLHKACIGGHSQAVRLICQEGVDSLDVNLRSPVTGHTPLHKACVAGWDMIVPSLLSHPRLDVAIQDWSGNTPLHLAVKNGHYPVARALLQQEQLQGQQQEELRTSSVINVNAR